MDVLDEAREYLRQVVLRPYPDEEKRSQILAILQESKKQAVILGDQARAKQVWILQTILAVQHHFLAAWDTMRREEYYAGWCVLERAEIELDFLWRHFNPEPHDEFSLRFIEKHTQQLQSLFPYRFFFSTGMLIREKTCSICGRVVSLRDSCGHRVGEIYNGEHCGRVITKAELLEVSVVTSPMHKYAVMFLQDGPGRASITMITLSCDS